MTIQTQYSQIDHQQWDALVKSSPVTSWFQTREAYCFFESLSFMEAFVVAVSEGNQLMGLAVGYIQGDGGWLKQRLSRRAIIIGGPLLSPNITDQQIKALLQTLRSNLKKRCIYIETRNFNDYSRWRTIFEGNGFTYEPHLNFHQDTTTIEAVDKNLSRTRKRHIHVGLRDGAELTVATTGQEVRDFYAILQHLYRNKVRKPLLPEEFFQKLHNLPSAKILVVKYRGQVIGGMAYVALEGHTGYEWYVCGMDEQFKGLYPSELATYAGLQYAAEHGCPHFDMMGAGKPGVPYGVRDFKALFGGTLVEYGRFLYTCQPLVYKAGQFIMKIITKH